MFKGVTLIEVLYAVALFAVVASTFLVSITRQLYGINLSNDELFAVSMAEEGIEATRAIRDLDWDALAEGTYGLNYASDTWAFAGEADEYQGFTRTVTITERSTNERQVDVNVLWDLSPTQPQLFTLSTVLSNWRNIFAFDTEGILTGNWTNPQTLATIELGTNVEATALRVKNKMLYVVGESATTAKEDFFIIDVSNPASPVTRGSIDTGDGLHDVYVSGTYAYVALDPPNSNTNQIQIISVSNPSNPVVVGQTTLVGNNQYTALSVAMTESGEYAFVGMEYNPGHELFTVRVSNPYNPNIIGQVPIEGDVNDIVVFGNYVFVATGQDDAELIIYDATYPWNLQYVTHVDLSGTNDALALYFNTEDNRLYVGRESQTGVGFDELHVFDMSNPASPIQLGQMDYSFNINGLFAGDELLFMATNEPNEELQIYDATDPANPLYYASLNFPQDATDIDYEDNTVYVSVRSNDAARIITSEQ